MNGFHPWQARGPTKHSVARKKVCGAGHQHDSRREAARCDQLALMLRAGVISDLRQQPFYAFGDAVLENGHRAGVTLDFAYREGGKDVAEDVKPRSKAADSRDWPLRKAMFRIFHKDVELREIRS